MEVDIISVRSRDFSPSSCVAAGGTRQGLMLWRSPLRGDSTAMLGPGSRRRTHYAHCVSSAQTTAASQITKRAARADPGPALLVATEIAPAGYRLPRVPPLSSLLDKNLGVSAKARAGSRRRASAQPRSAGLVARARSALRQLTCRSCLSAVSEANVASSATGPRDRASQGTLAKRGQAAKRRRLPARAFARANRRERTPADCSRTTAMGREPPLSAAMLRASRVAHKVVEPRG